MRSLASFRAEVLGEGREIFESLVSETNATYPLYMREVQQGICRDLWVGVADNLFRPSVPAVWQGSERALNRVVR